MRGTGFEQRRDGRHHFVRPLRLVPFESWSALVTHEMFAPSARDRIRTTVGRSGSLSLFASRAATSLIRILERTRLSRDVRAECAGQDSNNAETVGLTPLGRCDSSRSNPSSRVHTAHVRSRWYARDRIRTCGRLHDSVLSAAPLAAWLPARSESYAGNRVRSCRSDRSQLWRTGSSGVQSGGTM